MNAENVGLGVFLERAKSLHRGRPSSTGTTTCRGSIGCGRRGQFRRLTLASGRKSLGFIRTFPRLREGGVGGQFWSVYVDTGLTGAGCGAGDDGADRRGLQHDSRLSECLWTGPFCGWGRGGFQKWESGVANRHGGRAFYGRFPLGRSGCSTGSAPDI